MIRSTGPDPESESPRQWLADGGFLSMSPDGLSTATLCFVNQVSRIQRFIVWIQPMRKKRVNVQQVVVNASPNRPLADELFKTFEGSHGGVPIGRPYRSSFKMR